MPFKLSGVSMEQALGDSSASSFQPSGWGITTGGAQVGVGVTAPVKAAPVATPIYKKAWFWIAVLGVGFVGYRMMKRKRGGKKGPLDLGALTGA